MEEWLLRTEYHGYAIEGHIVLAHCAEEEVPKLILDEENSTGFYGLDQTLGIAGGVGGQIADHIGHGVVLAHLVARGGVESEHYLLIGVLLLKSLYQRASLLKLTKGCSMNPHTSCEVASLAESRPGLAATLAEQLGFVVEK